MIEDITIQLADGTEKIEDCMGKVEHYCRPISDGGIRAFELYDQIPVNEDYFPGYPAYHKAKSECTAYIPNAYNSNF